MTTPHASEPRDVRALLASGPIHFMGVGGAGMCALAEAVVRQGGAVTGCDLNPGSAVKPLEQLGVRVVRGHDAAHVTGIAGLVVSAAVPAGHPEVDAAREAGVPVLKRAEALGGWVNSGRVVAVAGTHGKTTTTAMTTQILAVAGHDPTGFVGGEVPSWSSHLRPGSGDLFVVEADEYDRSFHHLRPTVAVIANLEPDHLDVYGDLSGVREGFRRFLEGLRDGGSIAVCADDPGASRLVVGQGASVITYGLSAGSRLRGVEVDASAGGIRTQVVEDGVRRGELRIPVPGAHNLRNALGAAAVARALGVEWTAIREALASFHGVRRRFQRIGAHRGILLVDDYAHHPTELRAALAAARDVNPTGRVVAVFQPHLYSRTRDFAEQFGAALAFADEVWVTAIYPAREEPIPGVDAELVARAAEAAGAERVVRHQELDTLPEALAAALRAGDLCITLGAGSIDGVAPKLLPLLSGGADA